MIRWSRRMLLAVLAGTALACSGGGGDEPAGPVRHYQLSATAVQAVAGGDPFYQLAPSGFTLADLAADVDVVTVFIEHYGVPWDEFAAAASPPEAHPWTATMRAFAAAARATGKPLMLQTVLSRQQIAGRAVDTGGRLVVDTAWTGPCFDFSVAPAGPRYRLAYQRYVAWLAGLFEPAHFVHAVEVSNYRKSCPSATAWQALVDTANDAYDAIKATRPTTRVYPSFILSELYGDQVDGHDTALVDAMAGLRRDRLGLSVYPQGMNAGAGTATPATLPADFFTRLRDRRPAEPAVVVTEGGWNTDDLPVGASPATCPVLAASTESTARDYLSVLLDRAEAQGIELVTWWSARDLLPANVMATCYPNASAPAYAACNGDPWCGAVNIFRASVPANPALGEVIFKGFGTMGLRRYDGTAKTDLMARWREALAKRFVATR